MTAEKDKGGRETDSMEAEQEMSPQEYEHLLAQYENSFKNLQEGQIIRRSILSVTGSDGIVDIGYKSAGIIPVSEVTDISGEETPKPEGSGDGRPVRIE